MKPSRYHRRDPDTRPPFPQRFVPFNGELPTVVPPGTAIYAVQTRARAICLRFLLLPSFSTVGRPISEIFNRRVHDCEHTRLLPCIIAPIKHREFPERASNCNNRVSGKRLPRNHQCSALKGIRESVAAGSLDYQWGMMGPVVVEIRFFTSSRVFERREREFGLSFHRLGSTCRLISDFIDCTSSWDRRGEIFDRVNIPGRAVSLN